MLSVYVAGDWHRAAHVWLFCQATGELLLQQRAACKDSWPNYWDISAAGHGAFISHSQVLQEE